MIDGIKIATKEVDVNYLLNCPQLNFNTLVNADTGEIKRNKYGTYTWFAYYRGLKFTLKQGTKEGFILLIDGSLHKYFNYGEHNYNRFTFENLSEVLIDLEERFHLILEKCVLNNLEFGLNVIPFIKPKIILKGLLSHRKSPFKSISMKNAEYYQVHHSNYYIKIYDKGKQYKKKRKSNEDILRFELKYVKMEDILTILKINNAIKGNDLTLNDLRFRKVHHLLGCQLLKIWREILMYDNTINTKKLKGKLKQKIAEWQNIHYWEGLSKQQKYKQKKRLNDITIKHSENIQSKLEKEFRDEIKLVIQKGLLSNQPKETKKVDLLTKENPSKKVSIDSINILSIGNPFPKSQSSKKVKVSIPDYEEWINDPRPLPF